MHDSFNKVTDAFLVLMTASAATHTTSFMWTYDEEGNDDGSAYYTLPCTALYNTI